MRCGEQPAGAICRQAVLDNDFLSDAALVRRESQLPDRCPKCSSYQVRSFYTPELEQDPPYLLVCHACGWEAPQQAQDLPAVLPAGD